MRSVDCRHFSQDGLYDQWERNAILKLRVTKSTKTVEEEMQKPCDSIFKGLTLSQIQGPFWVACAGYTLSTLVFIVEHLQSHRKKVILN